MKSYRFVISKSKKNNEWYFTFIAPNGKKMLISEGYKTKRSAEKTITSIIDNAIDADIEILQEKEK